MCHGTPIAHPPSTASPVVVGDRSGTRPENERNARPLHRAVSRRRGPVARRSVHLTNKHPSKGRNEVPPEPAISVDEVHELVRRAVRAIVAGDAGSVDLFTEDVVGDSPNMRVRSRSELECQLLDRAGALTNIELTIDSVEIMGSVVTAVWSMSADHSGEVLFNEDELYEPSGRRVHLSVRSIIQLRGGLICAIRNDYDDEDLFNQVTAEQPPDT